MPSSRGTFTAYQRPLPSPVSHRSPVPEWTQTYLTTEANILTTYLIFRRAHVRTWEESRRELVQGDGHDFGREAEGVFDTCGETRTNHASWAKLVPFYLLLALVFGVTISVMQVDVHVQDPLVLLPQSENPQHGVVHVTEARRLVPVRRKKGKVWPLPGAPPTGPEQVDLLLGMVPPSSPVDGHVTLLVQQTLGRRQRGATYCRRIVIYPLHHWTVVTWRGMKRQEKKIGSEDDGNERTVWLENKWVATSRCLDAGKGGGALLLQPGGRMERRTKGGS